MKNAMWWLALSATLMGCNGEGSTETDDTNDTDTTTDDSGVDFPDNNTIDKAQALELTDGQVVLQEAIEVADDTDFFSLNVVEGSWYHVFSTRTNQANDGGEPDTVLTIYDESQAQIGQIDDMSDRQYDTDSAISFRAQTTGTYYIQVQEWTEWDPNSAGEGNASWTYYLAVFEQAANLEYTEDNAADGIDNDSVDDVLASIDADGAYPSGYRDIWSQFGEALHGITDLAEAGFHVQFPGTIEPAGDVDVYATVREASDTDPYTPVVCSWSLYPSLPSSLDASFRILDSDGEPVADTVAPYNTPYTEATGKYVDFFEPGGIVMPWLDPGEFFLEISDASGAGGMGHYYLLDEWVYCTLLTVEGTGTDPDTIIYAIDGESSSPDYDQASNLTMNDLASGDGSWANFLGYFDTESDLDSFKINGNAASGDTISVMVQTSFRGSLADGVTVNLLDNNGTQLGTGSITAEGYAEIRELPLTTGAPLYITVTDDSGNTGKGAYYFGYVLVEN